MTGIEICRKYYEIYVAPMIEQEFAQYKSQIAVGLVGEGSDCYGFDDDKSRDHDWGPDCCLWLPDRLYDEIGDRLKEAYAKLPTEFLGYKRVKSPQGTDRRGVLKISDFYQKLLGFAPGTVIDWAAVEDYALAVVTNGEVFIDELGEFSRIRKVLQHGYPEYVRLLKIAQAAAKFSQNGQYNYFRMTERGDYFTADMLLMESVKQAMLLQHFVCGVYPPHDKWLKKSTMRLENGAELLNILNGIYACINPSAADRAGKVKELQALLEAVGAFFAREMYAKNIISDVDWYLDHHTDELVKKSEIIMIEHDTLVDKIARMEFEAFDKVENEGGRASCQNDWPTFYVMRKSQYLTWTQPMLMQYYYDFNREMSLGHNLITEKYGRMMESTAPERYAEIKQHFPVLSDAKKELVEQIVRIQMQMVEDFAKEYPNVIQNARNLHTSEDSMWDTSYETYLRGEISTYSDKMLQLYGQYVVQCVQSGNNIARMTITNTAKLYGYKNLEEFATKA